MSRQWLLKPTRFRSGLLAPLALLLLSLLASAGCTATGGSLGSASSTDWPGFMPIIQPAMSESQVPATVPADLVVEPLTAGTSDALARWQGRWRGWACRRWACDIRIVVDWVTDSGARVAYAAASKSLSPYYTRGAARFVRNELKLPLVSDNELIMRLRPNGDMEMLVERSDGQWTVAGILTKRPFEYQRFVERVPTGRIVDGKPQTLHMLRYSPKGAGPFPTIIMNHGSASRRGVKRNVADPSLGIYFARQGWQTVFPARRGRGQSDGQYNEGHKKNSGEYACAPEESLPGVDRALSDIKAVVQHLKASGYAKGKRVVMGGHSRGGILSVAYAGKYPADVAGVINFVGGWISDQCQFADQINPTIFKRGANYPHPTIWIYGENDPFYSLAHSRRNFEAFTAAGGKGEFLSYRLPRKQNGHFVQGRPDLWGGKMTRYLLDAGNR